MQVFFKKEKKKNRIAINHFSFFISLANFFVLLFDCIIGFLKTFESVFFSNRFFWAVK